jgi:hypothetical protein
MTSRKTKTKTNEETDEPLQESVNENENELPKETSDKTLRQRAFSKRQFLISRPRDRNILDALLEDGKKYTSEEVEGIIIDFRKTEL